jgi:spectinomycin phosphotransferase
MLEKPDISEELIISCLKNNYDLPVAELIFLPIGADQSSAVYRAVTNDGTSYFLKLRKGFSEIAVTVPLFLKSQGIDAIIVPLATRSKQYWTDLGEYKTILYPFIEGKDGFEIEVTDDLKQELGAILKRIHTVTIPLELKRKIPREGFSPYWRERLKDLQRYVESTLFEELSAAKLAALMKARGDEIRHLIERTEELASELRFKSMDLVLCHTDIHGGNLLIRMDGQLPVLYIVDWDNPLLAPKERDLMFVGGGIDNLWKSVRDEAVFYQGYGTVDVDRAVMAYYRYERVIEDLVAYGEQLLLSDEGGADRESAYRRFAGNLDPGSTIEIAEKTDSAT